MPFYEYRCANCKSVFEHSLPISEYKQPESNNCPSCDAAESVKQLIPQTNIGDPVMLGIRKISPTLKEKLRSIKKHHPGSTIKV